MRILVGLGVALLLSCSAPKGKKATGRITVAAAANLTDVFAAVARSFRAATGIEVVFNFGSTAELAQQVENGAPFDLLAAADTTHVDALIASGKLTKESRLIYAI